MDLIRLPKPADGAALVALQAPAKGEAAEGMTLQGVGMPFGVLLNRGGTDINIGADGTLEIVEYDKTIYDPGAFDAWIQDPAKARRIKFLFGHGFDTVAAVAIDHGIQGQQPIGVIESLETDSFSLRFQARLLDTQIGREMAENVRVGALNETSVYAPPIAVSYVQEGEFMVRHIEEAELHEISLVVWGEAGPQGSRITNQFTQCDNCGGPRVIVRSGAAPSAQDKDPDPAQVEAFARQDAEVAELQR